MGNETKRSVRACLHGAYFADSGNGHLPRMADADPDCVHDPATVVSLGPDPNLAACGPARGRTLGPDGVPDDVVPPIDRPRLPRRDRIRSGRNPPGDPPYPSPQTTRPLLASRVHATLPLPRFGRPGGDQRCNPIHDERPRGILSGGNRFWKLPRSTAAELGREPCAEFRSLASAVCRRCRLDRISAEQDYHRTIPSHGLPRVHSVAVPTTIYGVLHGPFHGAFHDNRAFRHPPEISIPTPARPSRRLLHCRISRFLLGDCELRSRHYDLNVPRDVQS